MSVARFRVCGRLDMASRQSHGTLAAEVREKKAAKRKARRR